MNEVEFRELESIKRLMILWLRFSGVSPGLIAVAVKDMEAKTIMNMFPVKKMK